MTARETNRCFSYRKTFRFKRKKNGCAPKDAPNLKKLCMDVRAFPVGNVLIFFCQTAGLLCLPCGKCFLVFLIVEAFQNCRIKASGQPLDDFVRVARVVYSFFLFVQRHLLFRSTHPVDTGSWNPSVEKPASILWKPENYKQEYKNTRPIRPSARMRLEPPSRADHRAAK